jgi:hypothetical protein
MDRNDQQAIEDLFRKLREVEQRAPQRDREAEALIRDHMARQPASPYYLAQTVVVQQAALKEAERRIEELENRNRDVRPSGPWDRPEPARRQDHGYGGGGFLAGAAQTALGVAGGVMLGSLIGSIFSVGPAHAAENSDQQDAGTDSDNGDAGNDAGDAGGFDGGGDFDMGGDF